MPGRLRGGGLQSVSRNWRPEVYVCKEEIGEAVGENSHKKKGTNEITNAETAKGACLSV